MPKLDLAALPDTMDLDCDLCVIGSGPAGATIAHEFSGTPFRVTVLESGGLLRHPDADELNEIESVGWPRVADQWLVRNRIVGGSSHSWSGKCAPFDQIDFEARGWVPHSGWPIEGSGLAPYLDRAAPYLGLNGACFAAQEFWQFAGRPAPPRRLDPAVLESFFWQYSQDHTNPSDYMRFGPRLRDNMGANVRLVTNANVLEINVNADADAAVSVEVAGPEGRQRNVNARRIVLCAGGIENPRILLGSRRVAATGVGNRHDQVGRYLMDHLRGNIGQFTVKGAGKLRKCYGHYRVKTNHVFAHGMRISPLVQRSEQLLNCAAWIAGDIAEDDPWNALRRLAQRRALLGRDTKAILVNLGLLARGLNDYFIERNGWPRKLDRLNLIGMCEQQPDPDSRVTLANRHDRFGRPQSRVDWRVHRSEARSLGRMAELVVEQFSQAGIDPPVLEPWVSEGALPASFQDVAHPTGTTRMGSDPAASVVDSDCQVHGVERLYVAGSSVFPTAGHANPTLMIVALALRLADHLKRGLHHG